MCVLGQVFGLRLACASSSSKQRVPAPGRGGQAAGQLRSDGHVLRPLL